MYQRHTTLYGSTAYTFQTDHARSIEQENNSLEIFCYEIIWVENISGSDSITMSEVCKVFYILYDYDQIISTVVLFKIN